MLERDLAVLGLQPGVDDAEIRRAYRNLAKKYHPDLSGRNTSLMFERVTHAYKNLTVAENTSRVLQYPARETPRKQYNRPEPPKDSVTGLGYILLSGASAAERVFAAKKLGNAGKKTAFVYLKRALYDSDPMVVRSSVQAIGRLKVSQSAGELSSAFSRGCADTRLEVLKAVEAIGVSGGFRNIVLQAMKDPSSLVRIKGIAMFAAEVNKRRQYG